MIAMIRKLLSIICLALLMIGAAEAQTGRRLPLLSGGVPSWVKAGATVDMDFANGRYYGCSLTSCLSITRASAGTDLLPSSASGFAYTTFGNNTLRITAGLGLLIEEARTNQLLNSTAPATQTTGSLGTGVYTLWVNGSGSATISAGTGTGCGTGTATNGIPVNFTITVAGTCIVTVVGSLNFEQLELGAFGTSGIVTAGATATRAADNISGARLLLTTTQGSALSVVMEVGLTFTTAGTGRLFGLSSNSDVFEIQAVNVRTFNSSVTLDGVPGSGGWNSVAKKVGFSADSSGRSIVFNNGTVATDAQALSSYLRTVVFIGSLGGTSNFGNSYVKRESLWNIRLSNVTLGALTQ